MMRLLRGLASLLLSLLSIQTAFADTEKKQEKIPCQGSTAWRDIFVRSRRTLLSDSKEQEKFVDALVVACSFTRLSIPGLSLEEARIKSWKRLIDEIFHDLVDNESRPPAENVKHLFLLAVATFVNPEEKAVLPQSMRNYTNQQHFEIFHRSRRLMPKITPDIFIGARIGEYADRYQSVIITDEEYFTLLTKSYSDRNDLEEDVRSRIHTAGSQYAAALAKVYTDLSVEQLEEKLERQKIYESLFEVGFAMLTEGLGPLAIKSISLSITRKVPGLKKNLEKIVASEQLREVLRDAISEGAKELTKKTGGHLGTVIASATFVNERDFLISIARQHYAMSQFIQESLHVLPSDELAALRILYDAYGAGEHTVDYYIKELKELAEAYKEQIEPIGNLRSTGAGAYGGGLPATGDTWTEIHTINSQLRLVVLDGSHSGNWCKITKIVVDEKFRKLAIEKQLYEYQKAKEVRKSAILYIAPLWSTPWADLKQCRN